MAGSEKKDAREVSKELEEMAGSKNKDAREVSKELEEIGGSEIEYEREINKGPNPYRSYDIEFAEHGGRIGKSADGAAFFCTNKEVQALAALQHRHVRHYFQAWKEGRVAVELNSSKEDDEEIEPPTNTCLIILDICPRSLQYEMKKELITREKSFDYFHQILKGVEHIHSNGWIHRDLSRDNIFIDSFDKIKIGDFSLAMEASKDKIDPDEVGWVGKKFYGAPEIYSDEVSPAADIYALGVLLFEMLYPVQTEFERHETLIPKDWKGGEKITELIKEMLDANPSLRPSASDYTCDDHH